MTSQLEWGGYFVRQAQYLDFRGLSALNKGTNIRLQYIVKRVLCTYYLCCCNSGEYWMIECATHNACTAFSFTAFNVTIDADHALFVVHSAFCFQAWVIQAFVERCEHCHAGVICRNFSSKLSVTKRKPLVGGFKLRMRF